MSKFFTDAFACIAGISLAVAVAVTGIKTNMTHMHTASLKRAEFAQMEGRSVQVGRTGHGREIKQARPVAAEPF